MHRIDRNETIEKSVIYTVNGKVYLIYSTDLKLLSKSLPINDVIFTKYVKKL